MPTSTRTTHARFYDMLRQICRCPTGGQGRPPLQDVVRGRRKCLQFCNCPPPGRCGHRPLRTYYVVAVCCTELLVHSAREGQNPSPTLVWQILRGRRKGVQICKCLLHNPSVAFGDSIPTLFVPSGHFPLIGGIDPLHKGAFTGAQFGSAYKKAAATRLPLYFTASGSWFYGRRRAGWRTFCCWSRT